ncbi:MAG: hypothetical protein WCT14_16055 [Treponemataceae bacterium]
MIDQDDPLALLTLVPRIRRARGFRLYTENGKRLVDLWQYGGAAALGHTPSRVLLAYKDTAARGLFCPFPSIYGRRFEQALSRLVPGRGAVRWYSGPLEADRALIASGLGAPVLSSFIDPALETPGAGCLAALWRPWIPIVPDAVLPTILCPVIPLPHPSRPVAFLLEPAIAERFPVSGPASPVILAAAARAIADLVACGDVANSQRRPSPPLEKALLSDLRRSFRGPYVRFSEAENPAAYTALFKRMLSAGFLLPPDPALSAILPGDLSNGEEKSLVTVLSVS